MFKNILYSLFTKGIVAAINFLILIISSRYLGVSSRGEISIFLLNIAIIQIVNEIYTGYSIVHFIPKFNLRKIIFTGVFLTLLFCVLSNSIIVLLHKQVPGYEWAGYIVSALVLLHTFFCMIILGKEKIRTYSFLNLLQPLLLLTGLLCCIFMFRIYTFKAYVLPLFFSFLGAAIISAIVIVRSSLENNLQKPFSVRPVLWNGFVFQSGLLMFIFVNRYSYYLLSDNAKVGLYASACSLMEAVLVISNGIAPVILSKAANEGDTNNNIEITLTLSKFCFLFSLLVVIIVAIIPASVYTYILGTGFAGIKNIMLIYSPGVVMVSLFATISTYFTAVGKQKLVLICYSLGFICTLVLAPVFIKQFDISGAAYTANISYFIICCGMCFSFFITGKLSFNRLFSFNEDFRNLRLLTGSKV